MSAAIRVCVICNRTLSGRTRRGAIINRLGVAEFEMHELCAQAIERDAKSRSELMCEGKAMILATAPTAGHA